jgi:hypothetical protein
MPGYMATVSISVRAFDGSFSDIAKSERSSRKVRKSWSAFQHLRRNAESFSNFGSDFRPRSFTYPSFAAKSRAASADFD